MTDQIELTGVRKTDIEKYDEFVDKFKAKKTTDDCYTPPNVYDAVANWVAQEYGLDRSAFVRPFYPGGDYENYDYPEGCVVVDNPPFSIITQIQRFYISRGIRYFLFAPTLTLFQGGHLGGCSIPCGVGVTYENGAQVNTSFVTNLDGARVRTAPELYRLVECENARNEALLHASHPKYGYPDHIITAAIVARWCKYGVDYRLMPEDCVKVPALDAQRQAGKTIFGNGFLLSERAAAERAAAERAAAERAAAIQWPLSDREWRIVETLGDGTPGSGRQRDTTQLDLFYGDENPQPVADLDDKEALPHEKQT